MTIKTRVCFPSTIETCDPSLLLRHVIPLFLLVRHLRHVPCTLLSFLLCSRLHSRSSSSYQSRAQRSLMNNHQSEPPSAS